MNVPVEASKTVPRNNQQDLHWLHPGHSAQHQHSDQHNISGSVLNNGSSQNFSGQTGSYAGTWSYSAMANCYPVSAECYPVSACPPVTLGSTVPAPVGLNHYYASPEVQTHANHLNYFPSGSGVTGLRSTQHWSYYNPNFAVNAQSQACGSTTRGQPHAYSDSLGSFANRLGSGGSLPINASQTSPLISHPSTGQVPCIPPPSVPASFSSKSQDMRDIKPANEVTSTGQAGGVAGKVKQRSRCRYVAPATCELCGQTCSSLGHLRRHKEAHGANRAYKCKFSGGGFVCTASYSRPDNLKKHFLNAHTGNTPPQN